MKNKEIEKKLVIKMKYGFEGIGRFSILEAVLKQSGKIDRGNSDQMQDLSLQLDLDMEQLNKFLDYLILSGILISEDNNLTTPEIQALFARKQRKAERNRRYYNAKKVKGKLEELTKVKPAQTKPAKAEKKEDNPKKEVIAKKLMTWFGFNELSNFAQMREIYLFLTYLDEHGQIDHFEQQFEFYRRYKKATKEKRHSFRSFIGSRDRYMEGGWNETNWKQKYNIEVNHQPISPAAKVLV